MSKNPLVGCGLVGTQYPSTPFANGRRNFSNKKSSLGNLCFCKISQLENLRSIVLMEKWRMKCVFSNSILKNLNPQLVSAIKWLAVGRAIASKKFLSKDRSNWWSFASLNSSPCPNMNVFSHLADQRWTIFDQDRWFLLARADPRVRRAI